MKGLHNVKIVPQYAVSSSSTVLMPRWVSFS